MIAHLKIYHKIVGVFGVLLVAMLLVGGFSVYQINALNSTAVLVGSNVNGLSDVTGSRAALFEAQRNITQAFAETPGSDRETLLASAASKLDQSLGAWKRYDSTCDSGEEREAADKVNELWKPFVEAIKAVRGNAGAEAVKAALRLGDGVSAAMQHNIDYQIGQSRSAVDAAASMSSRSMLLVGLSLGVVLVVASVVCAMLARNVAGPLSQLTSAMGALARDTTDVAVPGLDRKDELGAMAQAVEVFKTAILQRAALEAEARANRSTNDSERLAQEATRTKDAGHNAFAMSRLAEGLERLSKGELAFRIDDEFAAAYETIRLNFNGTLESLQDTMKVVNGNTSAIRSGTEEISSAADDLSRRTEQQAASLEETAAALDEITATVRKTAEGSKHARDVVGQAKKDAEHSGQVVRQAVEAMSGIEKSANQISQIIGVIDEIAFQTNLLALNAGVEAARAGDAGRGFAVVASEVRALAQRSADAAKEIKTLISASGQQVEVGVDLVAQTGKALDRIVHQVNEINGIVGGIAASAQEQATGLDQVNTAINQMDQVTQQNAAMVEQSTAASHALAQETEQLMRLIARFDVGREVSPSPVRAERKPIRAIKSAVAAKPSAAAKPVAGLRSVGRGGAVPAPEPASDWQEF